MGWEGVEAELKGVKLNSFKLEDFNVPYGHSPLLVAHPDFIRSDAGLDQLQGKALASSSICHSEELTVS